MLRFAQFVVALAGCYLLALGTTALVRPAHAKRFLEAHASTARAHFIELALRLLVGGALLVAAPHMPGVAVVRAAGWVLVGTTLLLAVTPWRVHHRFAAWAVPLATRQMALLGVGALIGGVVVLGALIRGARGA